MKKLIFCIALVTTTLTSCSLYKNYERPTDIQTTNLYGEVVADNASTSSLATLDWHDLYTDPNLQALIEKALAGNADIKIQEWAIEQAKSTRSMKKKAWLPELALKPDGGYTHIFNRKDSEMSSGEWTYNIPIALNWEFEFWGQQRNNVKMADANVLMQRDIQQTVKARLVANIASMYYQLQALDQVRLIAQEAMSAWDEMTKTSQAMMDNGMADAISVVQFKGQSYEIEASLKDIEHNITQLELNICTMLGETPHPIVRSAILNSASPEMLRAGLSSELLANRPDVRQAERNLMYYYHNELVARGEFYPKFNINAQAAFNGNFVLGFLGSLTQPIFARGRIKAGLEIAKAQYEQAKLAFQQKLIEAGSEVVLALSRCNTAHDKTISREKQIEQYFKAVEYSRIQMANGEATYLDVLTAQSSLFQTQKALVDDRLEELLGIVNLYLALGGAADPVVADQPATTQPTETQTAN